MNVYKRIEGAIVANEGVDCVIMNPLNGGYYFTNKIGLTIWEGLSEPVKLADLVGLVTETYDQKNIDTSRIEVDIKQFLSELAANDLLNIQSRV